MLQAMYSGVSGLLAQQTEMNTIGNNIANVNTVGFKSSDVTFEDQLSQILRPASDSTINIGTGGTDPLQVGLGVSVGTTNVNETQGTLQSTGVSTDLAIQGNGYFILSNGGNGLAYSRAGGFELDSTGALVDPATGYKVLGYQADQFGNINQSAPVTSASALQVPIGLLANAKQTANVTTSGNLDAGASLSSTQVTNTGNLSSAALPTDTVTNTVTVYDSLGNAHTVQTTFSNPNSSPSGAGVPAGATMSWDVSVKVDGNTVYDSTAGKSAIYEVGGTWEFADATGTSLGSDIDLNGGANMNDAAQITGTNGAPNFSVDLNYQALTNTASASSLQGVADGQSGSTPTWGSSIQVFDSLGVSHLITITYTHAHVGAGAPTGATAEWDWTATENGQTVGSSSSAGNTPLYFGSSGTLVGGASQSITITPSSGAVSPFTVKIDNSQLSQLSSTSTATVGSQDGFPVGTLQSFNISPDGVITGQFSSGQSRALGQIALASFANPGGLENLGNNLLGVTANSGSATLGVANQGGMGNINPGYLESSNVDLSTEFTNLIVTERGFQANTKIVTTVDQLLQDVLNMKQ